jgi:hypothetical protein
MTLTEHEQSLHSFTIHPAFLPPLSNTSSPSYARLILTHDDSFCRPISQPTPSFFHKLGPKALLVYMTTPHPKCSMKHLLSFRSPIHDRYKWLTGAIKLVGRLPPIPFLKKEDKELPDVAEEELPPLPNLFVPPGAHSSHPALPKAFLP